MLFAESPYYCSHSYYSTEQSASTIYYYYTYYIYYNICKLVAVSISLSLITILVNPFLVLGATALVSEATTLVLGATLGVSGAPTYNDNSHFVS